MTNYGVTLAENPVRYGIDLYVLGDDSRPT
jgi:hypothetical protein